MSRYGEHRISRRRGRQGWLQRWGSVFPKLTDEQSSASRQSKDRSLRRKEQKDGRAWDLQSSTGVHSSANINLQERQEQKMDLSGEKALKTVQCCATVDHGGSIPIEKRKPARQPLNLGMENLRVSAVWEILFFCHIIDGARGWEIFEFPPLFFFFL